ncbi:MAG: nitric oxide synthase oxygenase [Nocardia sp.]|uniref:nitric oxide synthase oxygenase n=1 Tax=Nocardia sp. TaxID=1821 RepID=UPI00260EA3C5|nr:nitric oxide synthase oxygenase [Nocardia sp.]MCU1642789.1 nitric oxide synthase oxygenase [Nocardia sp.]
MMIPTAVTDPQLADEVDPGCPYRNSPAHQVLDVRAASAEDRETECTQFFALPEIAHLPAQRGGAAVRQLRRTGSYHHTLEELSIGTKLAWRNHDRCVGRRQWRALEVVDARDAETAAELAAACLEHLRRATNGGAVRSVITIGPPADAEGRGFRILNSQFIRYAGYRVGDGIVGDPANVELTDLARELGWRAPGGRFDVLPLLIRTPSGAIQCFDVPPEFVLEVPLRHPEFSWFADLGLKWHAVPAVSNMDLEIGGLTYAFAPFNGWYVSSEIGRNLGDSDRYDMLPAIADEMGLDRSTERTLWRDQALVELSRAILHSYRQSRVHLVDHHTVARQFLDHVDREHIAGRSCPTDWTWINPPLSASLTPTFHRSYDPPDPHIRPAFIRRGTSRPGPPAETPATAPAPLWRNLFRSRRR